VILAVTAALIGSDIVDHAWLEIEDERIAAIGQGTPPSAPNELVSGTIVPGFVDIHSHGGGGFNFSSPDPDELSLILSTHLQKGTTSQMASLVTEPLAELHRQITSLAPYVQSGAICGIHLEGPYLSQTYCGAHDPSLLRIPDLHEISDLIDHGDGTIRMITIAPELPNAIDAISMIVKRGVVAAIGHSDADYEVTKRAIDAGATVVTHFYNGLRGIDHHDPALTLATLLDDRMTLELILDGLHVKAPAVDLVLRCAPARVALITDAMAAAGVGNGNYTIGSLAVVVKDGAARLASNGSLAGSTLTMDRAFQRLVRDHDYSIPDASYAASTLPARALQLTNVGGIEVGKRADLIELQGAQVTRVMSRGVWVP